MMLSNWVDRTAIAIVKELKDRSLGIDSLDADTLKEITEAIAAIIRHEAALG